MPAPLPDGPQRFTISHPNDADFKTGGLRDTRRIATSASQRRRAASRRRT
jgi:hypothetical protein